MLIQYSLTINQCCLFIIYTSVFVVIVFGDWIEIPQVNKFQTRYHYNKPIPTTPRSPSSPIVPDYKQLFTTTTGEKLREPNVNWKLEQEQSQQRVVGAAATTTDSFYLISTEPFSNNNDYDSTTVTMTITNDDDQIMFVNNGNVNGGNTRSQIITSKKPDFADNRNFVGVDNMNNNGGRKETQINKPEVAFYYF